jgi:hypothetical protein
VPSRSNTGAALGVGSDRVLSLGPAGRGEAAVTGILVDADAAERVPVDRGCRLDVVKAAPGPSYISRKSIARDVEIDDGNRLKEGAAKSRHYVDRTLVCRESSQVSAEEDRSDARRLACTVDLNSYGELYVHAAGHV